MYNFNMKTRSLSSAEVTAARKRRLMAMQLQAVESNPLGREQIAMFEMFEREAWPHDKRRAFILAKVRASAAE